MSTAGPQVSVVIPTFRGGSYLREAVRSVLDQTFTDFELIIVADGCEDDLLDVEALDERVRCIRQPNRGESVARNVGIRAARCELIAFLDDDDRMLPGRLAAQYQEMEGQPEVGLCHTQFRVIDANGTPTGEGYARHVEYLDLLRSEFGALMPTTMMRKSLLQEVGMFDSALRTCQDIDVILRLASRSRLAFDGTVLTEYRQHGNNASRDRRIAGQTLEALLAKHLSFARLRGDDIAAAAASMGVARMRRFTGVACLAQARDALRNGDRLAALRLFAQAVRLSPVDTARDLLGNRRPIRAMRARAPSP
jgi:glycosyltransferase involved in cell wall biosynthesis